MKRAPIPFSASSLFPSRQPRTARATPRALGSVVLALGFSLALVPSAQAASLELSTQARIRIDGAAAGDWAGNSVASAGDVNGDGRPDVLVGAPNAGNNGRKHSDSVFVVFGQAGGGMVDLGRLGAEGKGSHTYVVFGQADGGNVDLRGVGAEGWGYRIDGPGGFPGTRSQARAT